MVKEAEANAETDKKKKEAIEIKNQADTLVYTTEKTLKEQGDKVSAEEKKKIEEAAAKLKTSIEKGSPDEIKKDMEALTQASHKLAEQMYKEAAKKQQDAGASSTQQEAQAAPEEEKKDEDVVDADYEVVDDKEKK